MYIFIPLAIGKIKTRFLAYQQQVPCTQSSKPSCVSCNLRTKVTEKKSIWPNPPVPYEYWRLYRSRSLHVNEGPKRGRTRPTQESKADGHYDGPESSKLRSAEAYRHNGT